MSTGNERIVWHEGERAVHRAAGVSDEIVLIGARNIRDFMPDQHRAFFAQLPFLVTGAVDKAGCPWASILSGAPGFLTTPDPRLLHIAAQPAEGDPLAEALRPGAAIGLLGIDLATRRRNRANGHVASMAADGFTVAVEQSFGNCPKYIQPRGYGPPLAVSRPRAEPLPAIDGAARALIRRADTCFVASATPGANDVRTADVSHRGGRPGFVDIAEDGAIVIPDYRGNHYFNTLGNLVVNPRAGLAFVDFESGDLLQLTGTTQIIWNGPQLRAFTGAERLWRLSCVQGNWLRGGFKLQTRRTGEPIGLEPDRK
jgi:uncharacterized protein